MLNGIRAVVALHRGRPAAPSRPRRRHIVNNRTTRRYFGRFAPFGPVEAIAETSPRVGGDLIAASESFSPDC